MTFTRTLVGIAAVLLAATSAPAYGASQPPTIARLARCFAAYPGLGCPLAPGVFSSNSATVDAGGRWLFTTASGTNGTGAGAVAVFGRDPQTGALRRRGCVSDDGSGDGCVDGNALLGARKLALSGDGRSAYVAGEGRLASFDRDGASGALRQIGCMKAERPLGVCGSEPLLPKEPAWAGVSPDGAYLYEVGPGRILVFARDPSTGLLTRSSCLSADTQSGCDPVTRLVGATSAVLAPDGRQLYVGAGALLLTFARDSATGTLSLAGCAATSPYARDSCAAGEATSYPTIATSPDGSVLWALSSAGGGALVSFVRDASDGTLHKRACASASGRSPCERVRELKGLRDFALAPDGRRLIVAAGQRDFGPDLLTFDVSGGRGPVLQACTSGVPSLRCSESEAIADAGYRVPLAFSPDGRDVYAALGGYHGAGGVFGFGPATGIATRSLAPTGGVAGVKLTCPDELPRDACAGRLAVEPPEFSGVKGLLGHKRYRVTAGSARTVRVHLTRSSVRRLLSRRPTRRVTIVATDDSGTTVASRQAATLRRGR